MNDYKSDKVLAFLMVGGLIFFSELTEENAFLFKDVKFEGMKAVIVGTDIRDQENFIINLANCISIKVIPRLDALRGSSFLTQDTAGRSH